MAAGRANLSGRGRACSGPGVPHPAIELASASTANEATEQERVVQPGMRAPSTDGGCILPCAGLPRNGGGFKPTCVGDSPAPTRRDCRTRVAPLAATHRRLRGARGLEDERCRIPDRKNQVANSVLPSISLGDSAAGHDVSRRPGSWIDLVGRQASLNRVQELLGNAAPALQCLQKADDDPVHRRPRVSFRVTGQAIDRAHRFHDDQLPVHAAMPSGAGRRRRELRRACMLVHGLRWTGAW